MKTIFIYRTVYTGKKQNRDTENKEHLFHNSCFAKEILFEMKGSAVSTGSMAKIRKNFELEAACCKLFDIPHRIYLIFYGLLSLYDQ